MGIPHQMKKTLFAIALICNAMLAHGEGQARITFTKNCLPRIKDHSELLSILSQYDIKEDGTCQAVEGPITATSTYSYPFVFPARLKGESGEYKFLIVIDYASSISDDHNRIIAGYKVQGDTVGVSVWPLSKPVPSY